ncbi:Hypothetical predicted protein [Cloeon dipterum]|uniref:Poly [ADP-ribose] polymerase n=1 Tax=Cloeon dipterum TaxID=197152 RepID=A0A8S1DKN2_9INSE|nr:Hypothetical predicted protein [Cloeon dipterum]
MPFWFHRDCFFKKHKPKALGDIAKLDSLRSEDLAFVKERLAASNGSTDSPADGSKKKGKTAEKRKSSGKKALPDFKCEYAASSRAVCIGCEQKIIKDEIRIAKMDYESEKAMRFGGIPRWHHVDCFVQTRAQNEFWGSVEDIPGFKTLKSEDRHELKKKIPAMKPVKKEAEGEPPSKKAKSEFSEEQMKEQNKRIFKLRDNLETLKTKNLQDLLEYNKQQIPSGRERLLDLLSDVMTFGALKKCPDCQNGSLYYRNNTYHCSAETEWSKCTYKTKEPERIEFKVPAAFKEDISFLTKYKSKVGKRLIQEFERSGSGSATASASSSGPAVARPKPPLDRMEFSLHSSLCKGEEKESLKKQIIRLGAKSVSKVSEKTMAVIASEALLKKGGKQIDDAKNLGIQVLPAAFFDTVVNNIKGNIADLVTKMSICDWGNDPNQRMPPEETEEEKALKSRKKSGSDRFASHGSSKIKVQMKNGAYVDPDSGLESKGRVYRDGSDLYTAILSNSDLASGKNSYYKLQIVESDKRNKWWLFKSWGRIGTSVGKTKLEEYNDVQIAITDFEDTFHEKTGNEWERRASFQKRPGKYFMQDIDYGQGQQDNLIKLEDGGVPSKLQPQVQQLMKLLFNVQAMKETLLEFELDLEKMPLGKLTQKQLRAAYSELAKLQESAHGDKKMSQTELIAISNKFYTLIPHSAGLDSLPLLDNEELIKSKLAMLDSLMELEVAYSLMKVKEEDQDKEAHPLDLQYSKLKTNISVLDRNSAEFAHLETYVKNTHAETHNQYSLDIEEIFKVERHDERKRNKVLDKWKNRHLLWHGSRITNFPGILSQGLRIAPPEAPVTGYMFGKGIYFADMVSKSANYCCTSKTNPHGLLLLCDVALGNVTERTNADYIEKLPKTFHSVKGVGKTQPDPSQVVELPHGTKIPLGKPANAPVNNTSLLYNEYIVYDQSQVKIEYLLKMKFNYKY